MRKVICKSIALTGTLLSMLSGIAQQPVTIKGEISDPVFEGGKVLLYSSLGKFSYDTTSVRNGKFIIKSEIAQPGKAIIYLEALTGEGETRKKGDTQHFYMDLSTIHIKGANIAEAQIIGGKSQEEYTTYQARLSDIGWVDNSTNDRELIEEKNRISLEFMQEYPDSYVSFDLMKDLATPNYLGDHHAKVAPIYQRLSENWRNSKDGQNIAQRLATAQRFGVGTMAPDFTMNDVDGNPVSLSDFRGQYVFLDFWASWCVPCRHENPTVVKAFEQYKDQNFTVVGVSLDEANAKQKWLDAIEEDGLVWTNLCALKPWKENEVANMYEVRSIPTNYLINPEGKIVAVSLRGKALLEKLAEVL